MSTSTMTAAGFDGVADFGVEVMQVRRDDDPTLGAESYLDGLRSCAEVFGFCAAIEVPFDAAAGRLRGFRRLADGSLAPVDAAYDAEAGDD